MRETVKKTAGSTFKTAKTGVNGLGRVSQQGFQKDGARRRNIRTVWTAAPAHTPKPYAVFPETLVENR